ncbi:MAG: NAD(P)/FAD-dependent oxidoreductase, partial [Raoultibacter sp.]
KQCQVQRGGFAPESFNAHTLESKTNPGLFVVGEALDIDGPCGGYNLHWAWTSGILAGRAAAGA